MPNLSSGQRMQIRLYLGWSERFHQTDSRLEHAMNGLDGPQQVDAQAQVITYLASLADVDAKLLDAHSRLKALKVGSIDLPGEKEIGMLRSEGRRYVGRIASLLGVEVRNDVFSGSGPRSFASSRGMFPADNGSGGLPPLG